MIGGGNSGLSGKSPGQPAPGMRPGQPGSLPSTQLPPHALPGATGKPLPGTSEKPGALTEQKPRPGSPGAVQNPPGTRSPNKTPTDHALPSGQQLPPLPGITSSPAAAPSLSGPRRLKHFRLRDSNPRPNRPPTSFPRNVDMLPQVRTAKPRLLSQVLPLLRNRKSPGSLRGKINSGVSRSRSISRRDRSSSGISRSRLISRRARSRSSGIRRSRPISRHARHSSSSSGAAAASLVCRPATNGLARAIIVLVGVASKWQTEPKMST